MCGFFDGFLCHVVVCLGFMFWCALVCFAVFWVLHVLFWGFCVVCGVCFECALVCFYVLIVVWVGGGFCDWCVLYNAYYNIHMYIILYMCGVRRNFGDFVGFVVLRFIWYPALHSSVGS